MASGFFPTAPDGPFNPTSGTDSTATLLRDTHAGVVSAFERKTRFMDKILVIPLNGSIGHQHTIEGKEDAIDAPIQEHARGASIDITSGTVDQRVINTDRPFYVARRIEKFDEDTTNYNVHSMNQRQVGTKLANAVDRKIFSALEVASGTTGLVGNGDGVVVTNTALNGGASDGLTAEARGKALIETIYACSAKIRETDDDSELFCALSPAEFQYLPQSLVIVDTDYTSGNGGLDTGRVAMVGGVSVFESNNMGGATTAGFKGIVFGYEGVAMSELWATKATIDNDVQSLDAKIIKGYFANGVAPLRPNCVAVFKNA